MEKWQTRLKLRIKGIPWKISIGFSYEWKAWLIAYEVFQTSPEEFGKLDTDKQISALAYGAAYWDMMKRGKKIFFDFKDIDQALLHASKADNLQLIKTMSYAQFPDWLKGNLPEGNKKKEI